MPKPFKIQSNIDYVEIDKLIDYYYKNQFDRYLSIAVTGTEGEVDAVFLSCLILLLSEDSKQEAHFVFPENYERDIIESLKAQLTHIQYTFNTKNIKLYQDKGEIRTSANYLESVNIEQSQKFIPPLFICKERNLNYFGKINPQKDNLLFPLYEKYHLKLVEEIQKQISPKPEWGKQKSFLEKIKLDNLSFIQVTLFRLLLSDDIYENKKVSEKQKEEVFLRHKKRILFYREFVEELADGLYELAKNIKEHSSKNKGVITARLYDKEQLLKLKDNTVEDFVKERDDDCFKVKRTNRKKEKITKQYFLDINVIDLSNDLVREKYVKNIKDNNDEIKEFTNEDYISDIEYIENKEKFKYKDFFVIDIEKISKIKHQQNKLISRIGLHYFTNILKDSTDSFIKASSIKYLSKKEQNENIEEDGVIFYNKKNGEEVVLYNKKGEKKYNFIRGGTLFNCIVPIKIKDFNVLEVTNNDEFNKETSDISTFNELVDYEIIDYKIGVTNGVTNKKPPLFKYSEEVNEDTEINKYADIIKIYKDIKKLILEKEKNIIVLDAKKIKLRSNNGNTNDSFNRSESDWIRLLSALNFYYKDIIVFNINKEEVKRILNIRKSWSKKLDFWNLDSRVLFYSIKESEDKQFRRFGATLLTGKTVNQFNLINSNIGNYHYNYGSNDGFIDKKIDTDEVLPNEIYETNLFINNNLIYFELLLTNKDVKDDSEISLFEESVQYSLNTEYKPHTEDTKNRGYKISSTHFRLGSKIHIKDFYYAKRLFQNSFFTTPLAFKLANYLFNKKALKENKEYTVVGYDTYSDFLVSSMRNLLDQWASGKVKINHCTISKDGNLSIDKEKLNENIFVVVPIASTFSTSTKIRKDIEGILSAKKKRGEIDKIFYLNIIFVADKESMESDDKIVNLDTTNDQKLEILSHFKWNKIDKSQKIINVTPFDATHQTKQIYFIPLYTKWEKAEDCNDCFPTEIENEKCLIETNPASVTPKLIFGYPKTKKTNKNGKNELDFKDSLLYGSLKRDNNNYLYFLKTGKIINNANNFENIKDWLKKTKRIFEENHKYEKIVIVTPSTNAKTNFLDLVNEHVFGYKANCLFISLEEDYIENSELLYADGLYKADIVIFVDDVLSTLKSFLEVNYIVKYIRNKIKNGRGIDYCISLINRMSYDNENNLILKLVQLNEKFDIEKTEEKLLYFTKINNPTIEEPNNEFPLEKERRRYKLLSNISSLDSIRHKFHNSKTNLKPNNLHESLEKNVYDHKRIPYKYKKLNQLLTLNAIYSLFEFEDDKYIYQEALTEIFINNNNETLLDIINEMLTQEYEHHHKEVLDTYEGNRQYTILKIICSTPLVYYKDIREAAFGWINTKLKEIIELINNFDENSFVNFFKKKNKKSYSDFQIFKFLLKRSVQLKSNLIFSPTFFVAIENLINLLKSDEYTLKKLLETYHSTNNTRIKIGIFNSILKNEKHFKKNNKKEYDDFISNISKEEMNELDTDQFVFSSDVEELARLLKFESMPDVSSKKLIIYIVSLVKELILEHETKSIKLENNIDYERKNINNERKNGKLVNGDFQHLLRLLKLENTEIFYKFWKYYKKEKTKGDKNEEIKSIDNLHDYKDNPKYELFKHMVDDKSFKSFLNIKAKLHNIELKNRKGELNNKEGNLTKDIRKILEECSNILGDDVKEAYLTVNYNKEKNITNKEQLYPFDYFNYKDAENKNKKNILSELNKSLTLEMFKNNSVE
ncbi:MAG: hypothetical protein GY932_14300, partial [Arcobacter sp.]|nr:hypothetical protein [Arcobacter sp.]